MRRKAQPHNSIFGIAWNSIPALMLVLLVLIVVGLFIVFIAQPVQAQTYRVIYNFTGGADGAQPAAGLTMDGEGNLYGTSSMGGSQSADCYYGCGTVFKLSHNRSGWVFSRIYAFRGGEDGSYPAARVTIGPDGNLYGTTVLGGVDCGIRNCGTVFKLKPPARAVSTSVFANWTKTILHYFAAGGDGSDPELSDLVFDSSGNIYGTTWSGGGLGYCVGYACGTVYKLTPAEGGWNEDILYRFTGGSDGGAPFGGVTLDDTGTLYGTAYLGGRADCHNNAYWPGCGTLYELRPSGSSWVETPLYTFQGGADGMNPSGSLVRDASGAFYGTTIAGGTGEVGTVFSLSPGCGGWSLGTLFSFTGHRYADVSGPVAGVSQDGQGNLYGTTANDGAYNYGNVFKLSQGSNGRVGEGCDSTALTGWTYTSLYEFCSDGPYSCSEGGEPYGGVLIAGGKLYGTTYYGGTGTACSFGCGVVWEITP